MEPLKTTAQGPGVISTRLSSVRTEQECFRLPQHLLELIARWRDIETGPVRRLLEYHQRSLVYRKCKALRSLHGKSEDTILQKI